VVVRLHTAELDPAPLDPAKLYLAELDSAAAQAPPAAGVCDGGGDSRGRLDAVAAVLRGERRAAVVHGDGRELLRALPDASIGAVITDPPYPRAYVPLYEQLAAALPRVLERGGSLLTIVPHHALPQVLAAVGRHLKYRWTLCMWQEAGSHPRMAMGIEVVWKPIVWWVNGAWPMGRGYVKDGFVNSPPAKSHHRWEQSLSWAEYCLRFVPRGGVVLDPLCGAGTTGVAAVRAGYRYIGVDHDPDVIAVARARVAAALTRAPGEECKA
jgi:site-specific DNA-methyltransferase (adenine-specific)